MTEEMKKISIDVPKKHWEAIVEDAKTERLKPSDMVRKIFRIYVEG